MRRGLLMLPFAFALVTVFSEAGEEKQVVFSSDAGKFTVTLPAKPKKQINKTPSDVGVIDVHLFLVDLKDKAYLTSYNDYPSGTVNDENRDKVLDGVRDGNVKGAKGKLLSEKKVTLGKQKLEGRELLIEMDSIKGFYRARIFLKGDRLYQVVAIGAGDWAKNEAVTKYLDSFEIDE